MIQRSGENVGAHHHAGAAAGRGVVDRTMAVLGEIADLHGVEQPTSLGQRAAGQAMAERPGKHLRVERQDSGRPAHRVT
jgi:hypothetical protein